MNKTYIDYKMYKLILLVKTCFRNNEPRPPYTFQYMKVITENRITVASVPGSHSIVRVEKSDANNILINAWFELLLSDGTYVAQFESHESAEAFFKERNNIEDFMEEDDIRPL